MVGAAAVGGEGFLYMLLGTPVFASTSGGNHGNWLCCHIANPVSVLR